jgi:hypothetical protein
MLTLSLGQDAVTVPAPTGIQVTPGLLELIQKAKEDSTNFGLLGVVAGTLLVGVLSFAAFKVSGAESSAKPAAVFGLGAASVGTFLVMRRRALIGRVPDLLRQPPTPEEFVKALRTEWIVGGMRAARI